MKHLGTAVLIIVAVIAGWIGRGLWDPSVVAVTSATQVEAAKVSLPPEAVLAVRPGSGRAEEAVKPKISATRQEINSYRNYGAIYARLASANPRTPEEQWLMARLLLMCGRVMSPEASKGGTSIRTSSPEEARAKFLDSLAMDDPDREKRIAAYDAMSGDPCKDLKSVEIQLKDWRLMLEQAAAAGELKARLDLVSQDVMEQARARWKAGDIAGRPIIAPTQMETIKQAIASGDPYSITVGVELLSNGYANLRLRDGLGQALDPHALTSAAEMMACDAGYPCGDTNRTLLMQCAHFDRCAATNIRDYTMYYGSSPYESQRIAQYEQALRNVVASGDWSGFRFDPTVPATTPGAPLQ